MRPFRVLAPIESGNLLLFPVVRAYGKSPGETPFITLDEGIKSGEVEVTEAGRVQGLVRPRMDPLIARRLCPARDSYRGDQVNTLVLVNNSRSRSCSSPAKSSPAASRTASSPKTASFPSAPIPSTSASSASSPAAGLRVPPPSAPPPKPLPTDSWFNPRCASAPWSRKISSRSGIPSAAPSRTWPLPPRLRPQPAADARPPQLRFGTTSYAKVMESSAVSEKVDEAAAPVMKSRDQVLAKLRERTRRRRHRRRPRRNRLGRPLRQHRSSLPLLDQARPLLRRREPHQRRNPRRPSVTDAQHFLDAPTGGTETSEGSVGVYRYRELKSSGTSTFVLESLLPGTGYDVHISKMKLDTECRDKPRPTQPPDLPLIQLMYRQSCVPWSRSGNG